MWKKALAEYLAAKAKYARARQQMWRASRTFFRLADRHGVEEKRAYMIAGVGLADERSVRAHQKMLRAFQRLAAAVESESRWARVRADGAAMYCYERPRAAND